MDRVNPIKTVNGSPIPCPSSYTWRLEDVSAADAGRTEDALMHKKMLRQVRALELSWSAVDTSVVSAVLNAFNDEYFEVEYLDPMTNGFRTATFYAGNRAAPIYNASMGLWSNVSFNIIER